MNVKVTVWKMSRIDSAKECEDSRGIVEAEEDEAKSGLDDSLDCSFAISVLARS